MVKILFTYCNYLLRKIKNPANLQKYIPCIGYHTGKRVFKVF